MGRLFATVTKAVRKRKGPIVPMSRTPSSFEAEGKNEKGGVDLAFIQKREDERKRRTARMKERTSRRHGKNVDKADGYKM
jgi:hypothetical protein